MNDRSGNDNASPSQAKGSPRSALEGNVDRNMLIINKILLRLEIDTFYSSDSVWSLPAMLRIQRDLPCVFAIFLNNSSL